MMKTLLITLFIFLATSVFAQDVKKQTTKQPTKTSVENVYICNGSSSKNIIRQKNVEDFPIVLQKPKKSQKMPL